MKKIVTLIISLVFVLTSAFPACAASDFSEIQYAVTYGDDGTATVVFEAYSLEAFDFGLIYDPNEIKIEEAVFSDYFNQISSDPAYTQMGIINDKARDDADKNTYVVFTGVSMTQESGEEVMYSHNKVASVKLSGISEGDRIGIVSGTAQVNDVRNAEHLGVVDLFNQTEVHDDSFFDGAATEKSANSTGAIDTWVYAVILVILIAVVIVIVLLSRKKQIDKSDEVVENNSDDKENDFDDEENDSDDEESDSNDEEND